MISNTLNFEIISFDLTAISNIQTFSSIGAAAASRVFNEALAKIAMNAQQGGTTDIGELNNLFFFLI